MPMPRSKMLLRPCTLPRRVFWVLLALATPVWADGGGRLTLPEREERPPAGEYRAPVAEPNPALIPYSPPPPAAPPQVISVPVQPQGYPVQQPPVQMPSMAPVQTAASPAAATEPQPEITLPHFIPESGIATQVQGRAPAAPGLRDASSPAIPPGGGIQPIAIQPPPPQAAPTPVVPAFTPQQPAAAAPATPKGPTTPVIQSFSLEQTFRNFAARQQPIAVNLWFPGAATLGNREIALGAAVVQGVALRSGESPLIASATPAIVPGRLNIIIGLPGELRGLVSEADIPAGTHGRLILRQVAQHANTELLIITGSNAEGIQSAILSLGLARFALPGVPTASIKKVVIPKAPPFMRREPVRGDAIHTFEYLYNNGTGLYRTPNGGMRVVMNLPGDFDATLPGDFILDLHTTAPSHYGSQNDRITARVNQSQEIISVPVGSNDGSSSRTTVLLPVRLFQIGQNTIELNFPGSSTRGFEVFRDSTLSTPRSTTPPSLPNLYLFSHTGYPLIGQPDGSEILVILAGRSVETIESTWTFMARAAQVSNTMFHATEYVSASDSKATPARGRHLIIIGSERSLPHAYQKEIPEDVFEHVIIKTKPDTEVVRGVNLKMLLERGRDAVVTNVAQTPAPLTEGPPPEADAPREERGFLACYPPRENSSKEREYGWTLLLTARTDQLLRDRTALLVQRAFWNQLDGSSVYWNQQPQSLEVYKPTPEPINPMQSVIGDSTWVEMPLGERFTTATWFKAVAITLLILIFTLIKSLQKNSNLRDYSA